MKLFRGRFGGVKIALLGFVAAGVLGYTGYRLIFTRSGEAAIVLIPADASCVVTLDTHPSEGQLAAFSKLSKALQREGVDHALEGQVNDAIGKAGIAKDVRQYLTHNMASAWWLGSNGMQGHAVGLFSISDGNAVSRILSSGTSVPGAGIPAYSFGRTDMICAVVGDYLAIASDADTIRRVEETRRGAPSVASLAEYKDARSALPPDANLMFFTSPSRFGELLGKHQPMGSSWIAFGASLRDGGIQFDYRGPVDRKAFPEIDTLSNLPALDHNLLKNLPANAYGLIAISSLDRFARTSESSAGRFMGRDAVNKNEGEFQKETGLSIDNDILPAFKGDVVLAFYPDATGSTKSADAVLMVDNSNGATPEQLAEKVRALLERKSAEQASKGDGTPIHFIESKSGQATIWSLDASSAQQMRKSLGSNPPGATSDPIFGNKNLTYAVSNGSVFVATSPAMLTQTMLTLNGDRSLVDDPAFAEMETHVNENDQFVLMCSLSRVFARFESDKPEDGKGVISADIVKALGGPDVGLVGAGRIVNGSTYGSLFLPLDFDRAAKAIASLSHVADRNEAIAQDRAGAGSPRL